jgi:hypothetical protein
MLLALFTCLWVPNLYSTVFISLRQRLSLSRERLCTKSKTLPTRGLPRARCPHALLIFSKFFKKKFRQLCWDRSHEWKVFWRKLKLVKSKDDGLRGMTSCYSFKDPSANALAATTRRLVSTSLVSSFHPISFQECSSDRQDSGPKRCFHKQNLD